jgi:hypothetical protein
MTCLLADTFYNYQHDELYPEHTAIRRSISNEGASGISEALHPTTQVTEIVQINGSSTTPAPPVGGSLTPKGSYVTKERNVTAATSQDVTDVSKPQVNFTVVNATVPLKNNSRGELIASL